MAHGSGGGSEERGEHAASGASGADGGPRTGRARPGAATAAMWLVVAVVAVNGVSALLTLLFQDQLVDAWARGRSDLGSVEPPAFAPVALTLFVVVALLVLVLLMLFRDGLDWARITLSVVVGVLALGTLAALRIGPPPLFVVACLVCIAVELAAVVMLWHKDARSYSRGAERVSRPPR